MKNKKPLYLLLCLAVLPFVRAEEKSNQPLQTVMTNKVVKKTDAEWKQLLTPDQYYVLRRKGTERPFNNAFNGLHDKGIFTCAACGNELFSSEAKFESGTGWPSFYQPIGTDSVTTETDRSFFGTRTEVLCARCGGHLGHVFDDGPKPTGLRYCMNSVAMKFEKQP
jgi:peptide-methionine (R)-S-oxide reductase